MSIEHLVKNLVSVAPNKGEAKKSVSGGLIRISVSLTNGSTAFLEGVATDDVLSIHQTEMVSIDDLITLFPEKIVDQMVVEDWVGYYLPETLRSWESWPKMDWHSPDQKFEPEFDRKFWQEHVIDSIMGQAELKAAHKLKIVPDRLRKFVLLEPRGFAVRWKFVEWADQSIIRWGYDDNINGVYAPLDIVEM